MSKSQTDIHSSWLAQLMNALFSSSRESSQKYTILEQDQLTHSTILEKKK